MDNSYTDMRTTRLTQGNRMMSLQGGTMGPHQLQNTSQQFQFKIQGEQVQNPALVKSIKRSRIDQLKSGMSKINDLTTLLSPGQEAQMMTDITNATLHNQKTNQQRTTWIDRLKQSKKGSVNNIRLRNNSMNMSSSMTPSRPNLMNTIDESVLLNQSIMIGRDALKHINNTSGKTLLNNTYQGSPTSLNALLARDRSDMGSGQKLYTGRPNILFQNSGLGKSA